MKRQLAVAIGIAILSGSAYATKARLIALGEDKDGSWYINDNRNMFRNASEINNYKDFITMELGSDAAYDADSSTDPKPEGGWFSSVGNFVYGVYLGNEQDAVAAARANSTGTTLNGEDNKIDLFFGGDAGVQWGVNVGYSSSEEETDGAAVLDPALEQNAMNVNLGVNGGNWEALANIQLTDEVDQDANNSYEGDTAYDLGFGYMFSDYKAYVRYTAKDYDAKVASVTTAFETSAIELGVGHTRNLNDKARLFSRVYYTTSSTESTAGATTTDTTDYQLPIVVGLEVDAASWLTFRGSLSQAIFSENETQIGTDVKANTDRNTTNVNFGSTLKFGNLEIDGLVGTGNNNAGAVVNEGGEQGILSLDRIMTRAAVTYRW